MKKEVEIISLIYKSVDYLEFIYKQLKSDFNKVKDWEVAVRIVGNDAIDDVRAALLKLDIESNFYKDKIPNDYYLNRVYRCWNYAVKSSAYKNVCFVNSDMAFSPGWLEALVNSFNSGWLVPCSRLVESGKLLSGEHALVKDFGRTPKEFKQEQWLDYAGQHINDRLISGGLYMPCVFNKEIFLEAGGYPEGNIYKDGIGTCNGQVIKSGDSYFFKDILDKMFRIKHITVFDSLIYHFQEGEIDEP